MKFIVKLHPEIIVKSQSVRKRFTKILDSNIRNILRHHTDATAVYNRWDHIEVTGKNPADRAMILNVLTHTPGIHHVLEVNQTGFTDLHNIYEQTLAVVKDQIENKTFCVRVKRRGKHEFTSIEIERYVGGGLNQAVESAKVKLKKPDITVNLEVDGEHLNLVLNRFEGLGGFPLGTQEDVLSLISGGFDSGVSSYMHIKRGSKVHYCFFNLGGDAHEIGVKKVASFLWHKYGSSAKVKFITIDFAPVVTEILEKVDNGQMGVVLKRMFMRAASIVAEKFKIQALVTGEALGQVSSQTLTNLRVIDQVTDTLILRPLVSWDKQDIINLADNIGTADFAKTIPEYCGVISNKPTIKAVKSKLEAEEAKFDFTILDDVVSNAEIIDIRTINQDSSNNLDQVEIVTSVATNDIVLDIRPTDEIELKPLDLNDTEIMYLPFYKLNTDFANLAQDKTYLLYCDRGVMSRMQALQLTEQGFKNIKVLNLAS